MGKGKGSAICQGFTDGAALCQEAKRERGSWLQAQELHDSHRYRYDHELQHSRTPPAIALSAVNIVQYKYRVTNLREC